MEIADVHFLKLELHPVSVTLAEKDRGLCTGGKSVLTEELTKYVSRVHQHLIDGQVLVALERPHPLTRISDMAVWYNHREHIWQQTTHLMSVAPKSIEPMVGGLLLGKVSLYMALQMCVGIVSKGQHLTVLVGMLLEDDRELVTSEPDVLTWYQRH